MSFALQAWVWAIAALVLVTLEVVLPAFLFLGFGIGAGAVALFLALGGAGLIGGSVPWLLVIFAGVSLVSWLVLRQVFKLKTGQVKVWTTDIND